MLHPHLRPQLPGLRALCQRLGVRQLYLFGSAVTERFDPAHSDVDVLVSFPPNLDPLDSGQRLLDLWEALEELVGRRVDLLTPDSLQNPFLKAEVEQTKYLIYDAERTEILV